MHVLATSDNLLVDDRRFRRAHPDRQGGTLEVDESDLLASFKLKESCDDGVVRDEHESETKAFSAVQSIEQGKLEQADGSNGDASAAAPRWLKLL